MKKFFSKNGISKIYLLIIFSMIGGIFFCVTKYKHLEEKRIQQAMDDPDLQINAPASTAAKPASTDPLKPTAECTTEGANCENAK